MISESGRGKKANAAKPALRKEVGMDRDDGIGCYRRFLAGDRSGLEELLALYRRALVLFVNGYVRDAALAEDIAIDVFFELYKRKKPFDETRGAAFKTYLFRIARNKALNALRKRGRRREEPLTGAESAEGDPEEKLIREERARAVHGAMEKLPEEYREAVYLKYFEGLSPEQIARVTGRRIKRVYNLLARGRAAMKEILTAEGIRNDE